MKTKRDKTNYKLTITHYYYYQTYKKKLKTLIREAKIVILYKQNKKLQSNG